MYDFNFNFKNHPAMGGFFVLEHSYSCITAGSAAGFAE